MHILGLNSHEINSSCAFIKNGKLIYGSTEERFSREKLTRAFPLSAINYYLNKNNLKIEDIDFIGQSWNPSAYLRKYNPIRSKNRIAREDYFYTIPDNLLNVKGDHNRNIGNNVSMNFDIKDFPKLYFIQHHDCHAANSFYLSNFDKAAILVSDFKGEFESTSFHLGTEKKIKKLKSFYMPNSLGMFYSAITDFLGYKPDQDEWKVMALSAIKNRDKTYDKKFKQLYKLCSNGEVKFNTEFFRGMDLSSPRLFTNQLVDLLGKKNFSKNLKYSDWHISIASALQKSAEEIASHFLRELYKITKVKKLCVSGGFFMNSVYNGKILEDTAFQELYVPFAPTDAGNSIGAAMYINHNLKNKPRVKQNFYSQIGPHYSDKDIVETIKARNLKFRKSHNIAAEAAKMIIHEGFIGYFEGKSEFGDRALGNRSILGDPRFLSIKDKINGAIKYRESYRPFAPLATKEDVKKYYEVGKNFTNFYMEKVIKIKKKYSKKLAAVTHFNNSARLQTVDSKYPNNLFKILKEFEKLSSFPILLNTSFNVSGEPIVLSPADAINTFYKSGLKILIIENYIISK